MKKFSERKLFYTRLSQEIVWGWTNSLEKQKKVTSKESMVVENKIEEKLLQNSKESQGKIQLGEEI
jgi:hypothetical protein